MKQKTLYLVFFSLLAMLNARLLLLFLSQRSMLGLIDYSLLFLALAWLTAYRPYPALLGFLALLPVLAGLGTTGLITAYNLIPAVFSVIYLSWYFAVIINKSLVPQAQTSEEYLVILLMLICLISMAAAFLQNPAALLLEALNRQGFPSVTDTLYYLEAGNLMLQGLSLFLMLRAESLENADPTALRLVLLMQVLGIIRFGLLQIITCQPAQDIKGLSIFSPFADKHSYGSYVLLLFFVFLSQAGLKGLKERSNLAVATILGLAVFLSYSRMTMLSLIIVLILYSWKHLAKKILVSALILVGLFVLSANVFYPSIIQLNDKMLTRYAQIFTIEHYSEDCNVISRMLFWNRAVNIVKAHPLAGSGIGSYFSGSLAYEDANLHKNAIAKGCSEYADKLENAHNYFLQIAAELGLPGLFTLIAIFLASPCLAGLWRARAGKESGLSCGLAYGLLAYILTWLTGHPLLISVQQFLFWGLLSLAGCLAARQQALIAPSGSSL